MTDLLSLSDQELATLKKDVEAEVRRRMLPIQMEAMNKAYLSSSGVVSGSAWRQPTGAHDAYPIDFLTTHLGKTWKSLVAGNVWEPGTSAWRELADFPAWVQPTGAHDAYPAGAQVTYNAEVWTSDVDANVWAPGVYGWTVQP